MCGAMLMSQLVTGAKLSMSAPAWRFVLARVSLIEPSG